MTAAALNSHSLCTAPNLSMKQMGECFATPYSASSQLTTLAGLGGDPAIERSATVNGLVRLFRNPRSGFPPDTPATQTVYYGDDLICTLKHDALRLSFLVEMTPSRQRIKEAVERQKKRYGFSSLEEKETRKKTQHRSE